MGSTEKLTSDWFVYLLECSDGSLYTGITTDIERRIQQHNDGTGAKYTRGRGPVRLIAARPMATQSMALKLEAVIKKQRKKEKHWTLLYYPIEVDHGKDQEISADPTHRGIKAPEG